jgi:hypothetical protein
MIQENFLKAKAFYIPCHLGKIGHKTHLSMNLIKIIFSYIFYFSSFLLGMFYSSVMPWLLN